MKRFVHLSVVAFFLLALLVSTHPIPSLAGDGQRVMVEFAPGRGAMVRSALNRAGGTVHHQFDHLNVIAVTLPTAALEGISRNPNVVSIAEDVPRYPMGQTIPWGIDRVQARDVWDADRDGVIDAGAPSGAGVTVCIIDSGLHTAHEDLAGVNVLGGYPNGWNTDGCGHGTHVAGTIAAANNDMGVVGVTPGATSLYIVKVFGDDCAWSYSSDLIDASERCRTAGADIISMSLGGPKGRGPWEKNQFNSLYNDGILSIAAAGNDGNTAYSYPASYDSVVSVAAIDEFNNIADFSQQNDQVELAAPGVDVLSTVPWEATNELVVDGVTFAANHIDYAAYGTASGALVYGGLCDSVGSWSGKVVLCERGEVSFYDKVINVQNGGGAAAVLYNNEPGNFLGTLGDGYSSDIVALSISQEDGQYLVNNKLGFNADVASSISIPDSGYEAWNGTSMATPHVSGVAALLLSSDLSLTNADLRSAMTQSALDLGAAGRDNAYGYGLVQAYNAWQLLGGGGGENTLPVASFTYSCTDLICDFDASASYDPDGSIVSYAWDLGDGATASGATASHTYAADGTYTVVLTVTDDASASASDSQNVSVSSGGGENIPPVASFTYSCSDLICDFDASASYDPDGSIVSYAWDLGDGATASGATASHTYAADGTYTVVLTVTDDASATASDSQNVSVSGGGGGDDTMHVAAIDMSSKSAGPNRFIYTTVTIVDEANAAVANATVYVVTTLPDGSTVSNSGLTGSDGSVTLEWKGRLSGTFTSEVTNVTHASLTYDPAANVETSDSITVQ
jgi:serine protease